MFRKRIGRVFSLTIMLLFAATAAAFPRLTVQPAGNPLAKEKLAAATQKCPPAEKATLITLTVIVEDGQDARRIPNAQVLVIFKAGGERDRNTNARGVAKICNLSPGEVSIKVIATGYETKCEDIDLRKSEEITFKLVKQS